MATKPSPIQWATGAKLTAANLNAGDYDVWQFMDVNRPVAHITQLTTQSIPTGAATAITFTNEVIDRDNQHDNVTNASRITLGSTLGWYLVWGQVTYAVNATGSRRAYIRQNGTALMPGSYTSVMGFNSADSNPFNTVVTCPVMVQATASTDYIELATFQFSGAALATFVGGGAASMLAVQYLGTFQ